MADDGGMVSKDVVFVTDITDIVKSVDIKSYDVASIKNVYKDSNPTGFSVVIIPAFSDVHTSFSINAPDYKNFGLTPLIGWIAGGLLSDVVLRPMAFNGAKRQALPTEAVVMHATLNDGLYADIDIVNLFQQGNGDEIEFLETGFSAQDVLINGKKENFANYAAQKHLDNRLPLVADFNSEFVNTSIKEIGSGRVSFYAPVFKGVVYKQAQAIDDYAKGFAKIVEDKKLTPTCAFNCILNFIYSELEGKKTAEITGPVAFGEIAYMLHNQTLVSLSIKKL